MYSSICCNVNVIFLFFVHSSSAGHCYLRLFGLQDSKSDERFHVELHFSPGVYNVGQNKEYLAGRGYRPQHGEKKQVPCCLHLLTTPSSSKEIMKCVLQKC